MRDLSLTKEIKRVQSKMVKTTTKSSSHHLKNEDVLAYHQPIHLQVVRSLKQWQDSRTGDSPNIRPLILLLTKNKCHQIQQVITSMKKCLIHLDQKRQL